MTQDQKEKAGRAILRQYGFEVEAVAWIRRQGEEFAAAVISNTRPELIAGARALFQREDAPLVIAYERTGKYDTRFYLAFRTPEGV